MSVWHSALEITLTRTSPAFGGCTTIVSFVSGSFGPHATAAWHSIGFPAVSWKLASNAGRR